MLQDIVRPVSLAVESKVHRRLPSFDPWSLITGTPTRQDNFDSVTVGSGINGRTMSGGTGTWVADAGWVGAEGGTVRSTTNGQAMKGNVTHANAAVRMIWHPGDTGDNQCSVFCRDTQSTAFPRFGFLLSTYPAYTGAPPAQAIALYRNDDYTFVNLSGFVAATIRRDWNVLELRCVGSTISGWLNGTKLIEMTDTAYGTARSRWGLAATNQSNTGARVTYVDFTTLA